MPKKEKKIHDGATQPLLPGMGGTAGSGVRSNTTESGLVIPETSGIRRKSRTSLRNLLNKKTDWGLIHNIFEENKKEDG